MLLAEIKAKLGISSLQLNTANDVNDKPTEWMRHWDNDNRCAVSIHKDLVAELKKNPNIATLGMQTETRTGEQGAYKAVRIVKFAEAETTL